MTMEESLPSQPYFRPTLEDYGLSVSDTARKIREREIMTKLDSFLIVV